MIILFESKKASLVLPAAPRFAQRTGLRCWLANHVAEHRGRQDASQHADTEGLHPYIHALLRKADHVAAAIDDALQEALLSMAQEISRHEATLAVSANPSNHPTNNATSPTGSQSSLVTDQARRRAAADATAQRRQQQDSAAATQAVAELRERQRHLQLAARDLASSWSARCDELIARHRRGVLQRKPDTNIPLPRHHANYPWTNTPSINHQEMHKP